MRKYFRLFLLASQDLFEYRVDLLWRLAAILIRTGTLYVLWINILQNGYGQNQYSSATLGIYYLSITFIAIVTEFNFREVADDIHQGHLVTHLLRPYNYFVQLFIGSIPLRILSLSLFLGSIGLMILFGLKFNFQFEQIHWAIVVIALASLMNFSLAITFGCLAFWFRRAHGFNALFYNLGGIFSGQLIPVDILPSQIAAIGNYLPFKYIFFYPAKLVTGSSISIPVSQIITSQITWLILLSLIAFGFWKLGISKFAAEGKG